MLDTRFFSLAKQNGDTDSFSEVIREKRKTTFQAPFKYFFFTRFTLHRFIDRISIELRLNQEKSGRGGKKTLDTWQICVVQDDREAGSYEVISVHNAMQSISALTIGLVNEQPLEFAINLGINHTPSRLLLESYVRNGNYQWNDTALRTISTVARRHFPTVLGEA